MGVADPHGPEDLEISFCGYRDRQLQHGDFIMTEVLRIFRYLVVVAVVFLLGVRPVVRMRILTGTGLLMLAT